MSSSRKILVAALALYVALVFAVPFASPLFFYWDEWSWLKSLSENSAPVWLLQKHLGHLYPLGRLAYLFEVVLFRDGYRAYLSVNVALHVLNTALLFHVARRFSGSDFASLLVSGLYLFTPVQIENVFWGMQVAVLLGTTCLLGSFACVGALAEAYRPRHLAGAVAASCAAPFMFDLLLPAPALALVLYSGATGGVTGLLRGEDQRCRRSAVILALAQLVVVALYLILGRLSSDHGNHPGAIDHVPISESLAAISPNHARYIVYGLGSLPLHFLGAISDSPPADPTMGLGLLLVLYAIAACALRSRWGAASRTYVAMITPLLFLLSLKRMYTFNTSLTGRYLTLLYVPCALFWAQATAALLTAVDSIVARRGWMSTGARCLLALCAIAVIAGDLVEQARFFRGDDRRWALQNAVSRQTAAARAIPRFYDLTDEAATSRRPLEGATSPELTEAEALQIRRVLLGR